jgi:hypothetical protein
MIKKLILAVAILGTAAYSQAQGLVNFNTRTLGTAARIYDVDGTTPLNGTGFYAQIYAVNGTTTDASTLTAKGTKVTFGTTSGSAGYVLTSGTYWDGTTINPFVAVSSDASAAVTIQVRAWSADTVSTEYATASKTGHSTLFQVASKASPDAPPTLDNFQGFSLTPEPATIALGALGLSVLLFRRRK